MSVDETTRILPLAIPIAPRVLIVDDDALVLDHLEALIAAAGFEVSRAGSGAAALDALQREFAPIVILDRNMPGMDGLALCKTIREQTWPSYVYLMLLTVQDSEEDILAGLGAGADDYLSKRTSAAQLVARLRTAQRILSLEHSLKSVAEERRQMAMTDSLTGAYNRRYFMRHLNREVKRTQRYGGELSVLALDIDHFKRINDRHGHAGGDAVLVEFVQRIRTGLPREYDWCARLGGEEFVVVLPQTGREGAGAVAEKLRRCIAESPFQIGVQAVNVTVSLGVTSMGAAADRDSTSVESLLRDADECLYQSKEMGRNRVTMADATPAA